MAEDGFLQRWSRRKSLQGLGTPDAKHQPDTLPVVGSNPGASPTPGDASQRRLAHPVTAPAPDAKDPALASRAQHSDPAPAPQLADAQALTPTSDFRPFMAQGVAPEVKNAAMKKLFADPHFNVMDRMDIYIDDYSQPDPLPLAMLRQMNGAKFLNLFEDQDQATDKTAGAPRPAADSGEPILSPEANGASTPASAHTTPIDAPLSADVSTAAKGTDPATNPSGMAPPHTGDTRLSAPTLPASKA